MNGWLTQLLGEQGATWTLYILGGAAVLVLAWVAWFWTRRVAGGVFVEGGRNRKHRLAVVDATAVDGDRRIVLVRRDDVEHLVMIGGQNDFVIENNIESAPAEAAQPRDRRGREAQPAAQGRRPLRREAPPAPARPPVRDEVRRPAAPASAPTPAAQPAVRETAPPEMPPAAAPVAAASIAATPALLRRVPEPAPAAPQSERVAPAMEPTVEPLRREVPQNPEPVRFAEESTVAAQRLEPFAERDEPLVQAPEPPQRPAEPEPVPYAEEVAVPVAVEAPEPPQPEEPVRAEAAEPIEQPEENEAVQEEAFTALFARGQGNGSTFAERFMFQTAKAADGPVAVSTLEPEPAAEVSEAEPREVETDEPSATLTAEPALEEPQHAEQLEAAVETALAQEMEPIAEVEEPSLETVEAVDSEVEPEPTAKQAPDNDDAERPSETLEDEMHRLLAQLTNGKR